MSLEGTTATTKSRINWTPPGKRKPRRPKTTWGKTVTTELKSGGMGRSAETGEGQTHVERKIFFLSFIKTYIVTYKQQNNNIIYQTCINKSKLQKVSNIKVQFAILICFYIY